LQHDKRLYAFRFETQSGATARTTTDLRIPESTCVTRRLRVGQNVSAFERKRAEIFSHRETNAAARIEGRILRHFGFSTYIEWPKAPDPLKSGHTIGI
jgi:hypothetical protein